MLMYVTRVPNRGSPPAVLLRESYRDGDKVKTRTLANLSRWPEAKIEALRLVLKGVPVAAAPDRLVIERSLPHGHVAAVLGMAKKLGLDRLLPRRPARLAKLALALVLRTSVPAEALDAPATVLAYKSLAQVERAFRSLKTVALEVRPVHHRLAGRVRAHVFLCLLAYHLVWHLRQALAPLLFEDHDRAGAATARSSPLAAARVSPAAAAKAASGRTTEGQPVHGWRSLLQDLATLTRNTVRLGDAPPITMLTRPTPLQQQVFHRLGLAL